jgi:hypothetical protein
MTETHTKQLWPRGTSITYKGDSHGDKLRIRTDRQTWRKATPEERRAIRIEELAEIYQDRDILHCDSCLVDDLLKAGMSGELSGEMAREWDYDSVANRTVDSSDWTVEQCWEWLEDKGIDKPDPDPWALSREAMVELLTDASIDCRDNETIETLRLALLANMDDETIDGLKDYRDAVSDNACEHEAEIYEWWRVTNWLADKLKGIGECVLDNAYGTWWGRCCTGQQYIMDGVLQRVAEQFAE